MNCITILDRDYKIVFTTLVVKDMKKGKVTINAIINTLKRNSHLLETIIGDTFMIEDAYNNTLISGYKDTEMIEIQCAVFRQHIELIII